MFELRKGTRWGFLYLMHEAEEYMKDWCLQVYLPYLHVCHAKPSFSWWRNQSNIKQKPEDTEKTQVLTVLHLLFIEQYLYSG